MTMSMIQNAPGRAEARTDARAASAPPQRPAAYQEISPTRIARLLGRGIRLRCPHCGEGRLRAGWLKLKFKCPACGLRTDRGEQDFFLGGMMWNLVFSEGMLVAAAVLIGYLTWPDVPWTLMQWVGISLMAIVPFVFYPFSLAFWLANDIWIRPVTEAEMEWHRQSGPGDFRPERDR
jgi:uncharacterized protein (DUF983 family)